MMVNPVDYVVSGFKPITRESAVKLKLINHSAMLSLTNGTATKSDWDYICAALNVAVVLAEHGIGVEYFDDIKTAMMAHAACGKRYYNGGRFGYTGEQLTAVNKALEIHDAQVDIATVAEMERGHIEVAKRLADKHISYRVKETA
jgi:hypothetical protein